MIQYAKDRDKAFEAFVKTDDFSHIEGLWSKYGMKPDIPRNVAMAGVYKAVQECSNISDDIKAMAREKCIALGFKPTMY